MEWIGNNNKAVAFVRVSSHRQAESQSFQETQLKEIETYANYHKLNIVSVKKIVESAKKSEDRKKFAEAEKWADDEGIRHRLYYMSDREARNLTDLERTEEKIMADRIVIHHVMERKVYWQGCSDADLFMREMQGITNKQYSRQLRTKAVVAQKTKAENGWFPGNKPPLGYMHERLGGKRGTIIVPDKDVKNVRHVQREFELRGRLGYTLEQIADRLLQEGFIKSSQRQNYESSVERRLKNKFYRGKFNWPRNGPEYEGEHELIISKELARLVDETFRGKAFRKKRGVFSGGWIKCGNDGCGCHVVFDPKRKKLKTGENKQYRLYRCSNGKHVHSSFKGMYISEEEIFEELGKAVERIKIDQGFADELATAINQAQFEIMNRYKNQITELQEAINSLIEREDQLFGLWDSGDIDKIVFDTQLKKARVKLPPALKAPIISTRK